MMDTKIDLVDAIRFRTFIRTGYMPTREKVNNTLVDAAGIDMEDLLDIPNDNYDLEFCTRYTEDEMFRERIAIIHAYVKSAGGK